MMGTSYTLSKAKNILTKDYSPLTYFIILISIISALQSFKIMQHFGQELNHLKLTYRKDHSAVSAVTQLFKPRHLPQPQHTTPPKKNKKLPLNLIHFMKDAT